jgi:3-deoxy-D-manno-octulosonic-acid transferase
MIRLFDLLYFVLVIPVTQFLLWAASLFLQKFAARRDAWRATLTTLRTMHTPGAVWVHAASAGEYEQVIPIIERLVSSGHPVVGSAFSPSGFEHQHRVGMNTHTVLLPLDAPTAMSAMFDAITPKLIIVSRYDLWRGMILEAERRGIPVMLINGTCPSAATTPVVGRWIADTYQRVQHISSVSRAEAARLKQVVGHTVALAPDTRIARVAQKAKQVDPVIMHWKRTDVTTLICASTWSDDDELLREALHSAARSDLRLVIVPHEPSEATLQRIESLFPCQRWSAVRDSEPREGNILVDMTGQLLSFYALADAAYVGGGFGAGVHSVMEPAAYGLALSCGPAIERSQVATELARTEALFVVHR